MTDSEYKAKLWFERYRDKYRQLQNSKDRLSLKEDLVNKCTSQYNSDGSGSSDVEEQMKRREDALADYSEMRKQVEKEEKELLDLFDELVNVIKQLSKPIHQTIAQAMYLRFCEWSQIQNEEHISRSTLHRYRNDMLHEAAKILNI